MILEVDKMARVKILESFGKTEEELSKDIMILKTWLHQRLPFSIKDTIDEDHFLERMYIGCKVRMEKCKSKVENYFVFKGLYKELFGTDIDGANEEVNGETFNYLNFTKCCLLVHEIGLKDDYHSGLRIIIDLDGLTFEHLKKMDLNIFHKAFRIFLDVYALRIPGIHLINYTTLVNFLITIIKKALPRKIFIHDNIEDLFSIVPKEYFPADYGGSQPSIKTLTRLYGEEIEKNKTYFESIFKLICPPDKQLTENEMFGIEGTFKSLNLN